jgi:hypothetical protein
VLSVVFFKKKPEERITLSRATQINNPFILSFLLAYRATEPQIEKVDFFLANFFLLHGVPPDLFIPYFYGFVKLPFSYVKYFYFILFGLFCFFGFGVGFYVGFSLSCHLCHG